MNTRFYNRSGNQSGANDWREALKEIQAARKEYTEYAQVMTAYERSVVERSIGERVGVLYPSLLAGIQAEHNAAIQKIQDSQTAKRREVTKEIDRWEPGRMVAELEVAQKRVNMSLSAGGLSPFSGGSPTTGGKLEALIQEARQSEDIYKKRAIYEALQDVTPKVDAGERLVVNRLSKDAERELAALRVTEGMTKAQEAEQAALAGYAQVRKQVLETAAALGQADPQGVFATGDFARIVRRVQVDRDTGQVVIYPEDSPEVTGIEWRGEWTINAAGG
jgi:hypothetical protein